MQISHYPDEDTIFVRVGKDATDRTREIDERRDIGLNDSGGLEWIVFHDVSGGVDLDIDLLPIDQSQELSEFLEDKHIPVFA